VASVAGSWGEAEGGAAELVGVASAGEGFFAGERAQGALVEAFLRDDPGEHRAHVGRRFGVAGDDFQASEAHALGVGTEGTAGLEIGDLGERLLPVALGNGEHLGGEAAGAGQSHRTFVGRAFASIGAEVRAPIEADGWPLILRFAALGLGVAVVNGVCEPPKGVVLRAVPELGTVSYRAFVRRGGKLEAAAESLVEGVRKAAREGGDAQR